MAEANHEPNGGAGASVRAALMNKVCGDEEMFALGSSVAQVIQMASSDDQGSHDLAYYVLSDVALTPEGVPADETSLIKALKGQVLAALGSG
jgi:hypothetical protein